MDALRFSDPKRERSPKNSPGTSRFTTTIRTSSMTTETDPTMTMYIAVAIEPLWQTHSF